ncbi:MAG TPA: PIN domain-containing protein [Oligoflexia bacterium]|nr:PIN domain-containing protein [Oligoflexia bacterium]HMP47565.1 PIN domain-containing protein [Oligoflexia bacterium]
MLVDSSVWIESSKPKSKSGNILKNLLINPEQVIYTSKIIQLEVSQGARTREQFSVIWDGFLGLDFLEINDNHWQICALNFFKCRKAGLTISTIDCLIATLAQQYHVSLWSLDKIFSHIAPVLGIELVSL